MKELQESKMTCRFLARGTLGGAAASGGGEVCREALGGIRLLAFLSRMSLFHSPLKDIFTGDTIVVIRVISCRALMCPVVASGFQKVASVEKSAVSVLFF